MDNMKTRKEAIISALANIGQSVRMQFDDTSDARPISEQLRDTKGFGKAFRGLLKVIMEGETIHVSPAQKEADRGRRLVYLTGKPIPKGDYSLLWFGANQDYASFHFHNGITLFMRYNFPYQERTDDDKMLKQEGIEIEMGEIPFPK
jgi:hypothetical protein